MPAHDFFTPPHQSPSHHHNTISHTLLGHKRAAPCDTSCACSPVVDNGATHKLDLITKSLDTLHGIYELLELKRKSTYHVIRSFCTVLVWQPLKHKCAIISWKGLSVLCMKEAGIMRADSEAVKQRPVVNFPPCLPQARSCSASSPYHPAHGGHSSRSTQGWLMCAVLKQDTMSVN